MVKSTIPAGVRTLLGWIEKGKLSLRADIQRAIDQWSSIQKSLLVHSILSDYIVMPLCFRKTKSEDGTIIYSCIEGIQRLSTLKQFCSEDEDVAFALNAATPEVEVDGTVYDLANMKFSDLSEECKDAILGFRFTIYCIEDATDEEISEIFERLNNSTPLTKIQKCRGILGFDLSKWTREITEMGFFTQALSLSAAQARREADFEILLQSMLLLDSRHEGYDWKGISTNDVTAYCEHIKNDYNDDKRLMVLEIADFLSQAFTEKHKWLKKTNAPMVFVLAKIALELDMPPTAFKVFIDSFSNSVDEDYSANTGSGNIKRPKTEGRLLAIVKAFEEYFKVSDCNILRVVDGVTPKRLDEEIDEDYWADDSESEAVDDSSSEEQIHDEEPEDNSGVAADVQASEEDGIENPEIDSDESSLDEESGVEDKIAEFDDGDDSMDYQGGIDEPGDADE